MAWTGSTLLTPLISIYVGRLQYVILHQAATNHFIFSANGVTNMLNGLSIVFRAHKLLSMNHILTVAVDFERRLVL